MKVINHIVAFDWLPDFLCSIVFHDSTLSYSKLKCLFFSFIDLFFSALGFLHFYVTFRRAKKIYCAIWFKYSDQNSTKLFCRGSFGNNHNNRAGKNDLKMKANDTQRIEYNIHLTFTLQNNFNNDIKQNSAHLFIAACDFFAVHTAHCIPSEKKMK